MRKQAYDLFCIAKEADSQHFIKVDSSKPYDISCSDKDTYYKLICSDKLFELYEEAYLKYCECNDFIDSHLQDIEFLKKKATKKDILSIVSMVAGVLSLLIGIATIVLPSL